MKVKSSNRDEQLWQIENLLIMSNVYFCHKCFKNMCVLQRRQKASVCGKWLRKYSNCGKLTFDNHSDDIVVLLFLYLIN